MMLHFRLMVNDDGIGVFTARRLHVLDSDDPEDTVSAYEVLIADDVGAIWSGTVRHRYGDGAWALVSRALMAREADMGLVVREYAGD